MKLYTNKSNARRAALKQYGSLDGLILHDADGMYCYGPKPGVPDEAGAAVSLPDGVDTPHDDLDTPNRKPPRQRKPKASVTTPAIGPDDAALVAHDAAATAVQRATTPQAARVPKLGKAPKAAAKKAASAKKAMTKKAPSRKEIADSYPRGVSKVPANEKKGTRTVTGYHLDKERDEAHGVQRKSKGTVGDQLWAVFDKALEQLRKKDKAAGAKDLLLGAVRKVGTDAGFNNTTVALAFYQWRRFHGVRGRGKKQKVD